MTSGARFFCIRYSFFFPSYIIRSKNLLISCSAFFALCCIIWRVSTCAGYCQFNWSTKSSTRHNSLLLTIWWGDAAGVSFWTIFLFSHVYFLLLLLFQNKLFSVPLVFWLNNKLRYAKSRMGMRSKKSRWMKNIFKLKKRVELLSISNWSRSHHSWHPLSEMFVPFSINVRP